MEHLREELEQIGLLRQVSGLETAAAAAAVVTVTVSRLLSS